MNHDAPLADLAYVVEVFSRGTGQRDVGIVLVLFHVLAIGRAVVAKRCPAAQRVLNTLPLLDFACWCVSLGPLVYFYTTLCGALAFWVYRWTVVWAPWRLVFHPLGWSDSFDRFTAASSVVLIALGVAALIATRCYDAWLPVRTTTAGRVAECLFHLLHGALFFLVPFYSSDRGDLTFLQLTRDMGVYTPATCTFALVAVVAIAALAREWVRPSARHVRLAGLLALQCLAVAQCAPLCAAYPLPAVLFLSIVPVTGV